jgi:hypothetical protein
MDDESSTSTYRYINKKHENTSNKISQKSDPIYLPIRNELEVTG